jgi:hypothetical protein
MSMNTDTVTATTSLSFRLFMGAVGVMVIGWGIAYGYATYQGDQCTKSTTARIESIQARMAAVGQSLAAQRK